MSGSESRARMVKSFGGKIESQRGALGGNQPMSYMSETSIERVYRTSSLCFKWGRTRDGERATISAVIGAGHLGKQGSEKSERPRGTAAKDLGPSRDKVEFETRARLGGPCPESEFCDAALTHLDLENNFISPPYEITFKVPGGPSLAVSLSPKGQAAQEAVG